MKRLWLIAVFLGVLVGLTAHAASSPWQQPVAALADQIASILGPGQAHLTIRNLSAISTDEIPSIRRLLEQDLKSRGVLASGAESANIIRVTLSENVRERLWVAEVVEGNQTRVVMVHVDPDSTPQAQASSEIVLRRQTLLTSGKAVLAVLETPHGLVTVQPEEIVIFAPSTGGSKEQERFAIGPKNPLPRDPRGIIVPTPGGKGFEAFVPDMVCSGSNRTAEPAAVWAVDCAPSDDPWTIVQPPWAQSAVDPPSQADVAAPLNAAVPSIKAFYNGARNYFTGVVTPSLGVDLPPFFSAAPVPRAAGVALLIGGIDGKIFILEAGSHRTTVPTDTSSSLVSKPVAGTRDWGSDFAVLHSGCGSGAQVIASGSGEAVNDSLRAYELPAQEAVPASAPLSMDGTVTALWASPDSKSVYAVVRKAPGPGSTDQYEVDRVTANCN